MPFNQPLPRSFNVPSVRAYAPERPGIYGISNSAEWIFIADTENIQAALFRHLQESDTMLVGRKPTGFVFEVCDGGNRTLRTDRLVLEYEPSCNRYGAMFAERNRKSRRS